jgi:hypothetical protein
MIRKILVPALLLLLSGCGDKLTYSALNGDYTGKFNYLHPESMKITTGEATISFSDHRFSTRRNSNNIPAGGSGTFDILKDKMIEFKDENIWTANFDWGLILNGKYSYELKGDSLILSRYREPCPNCSMVPSLYQYRLKRSN